MRSDDAARRDRRQVYWLLIVIALALVTGRIMSVISREGDTAFLSANDRSRWCTVSALVEDGTYVIDRQISLRTRQNRQPWATIDLVRHRGRDGQLHFYSSKPPLLATLVAGVYGVVRFVTGLTLTEQPIYLTRLLLVLVNVPLYALFLISMTRVIELFGRDDWSRKLAAGFVCFGTMLLPFTLALNNHLPAAAASAAALWIYLVAAERLADPAPLSVHPISWWIWFAAGLAAAMAAACELPALSMTVFWIVLFGLLERRAVLPFLAGAGVVAIAFFATNWLAHQSLRPPYAHRSLGESIATIELPELDEQQDADAESIASIGVERIAEELREQGRISGDETITIHASGLAGRWIVQTDQDRLFALLARGHTESGQAVQYELAEWDDWYDYPGSYWRGMPRRGVDRGEPSRLLYLLQLSVGHHGLISLTPLFLFAPWGLLLGSRAGPLDTRRLALAVTVASIVCIAFYVMRPEIDRNYGGVSVCFRWLLWMVPYWVLACLLAFDRLAESVQGRISLLGLLAVSIFSVAASLQTPWEHPWLYRFWAFLGWIVD